MPNKSSPTSDSHPEVTRRETPSCTDAELFEAFGNPVRRQTLSYLYSTPRKVVSMDELVERCVEEEAVPIGDRDRLAFDLHHSHLPQLADAGFLDYCPDAKEVLGPDADIVDASVTKMTDALCRVVE